MDQTIQVITLTAIVSSPYFLNFPAPMLEILLITEQTLSLSLSLPCHCRSREDEPTDCAGDTSKVVHSFLDMCTTSGPSCGTAEEIYQKMDEAFAKEHHTVEKLCESVRR